jgi:hypothetical protein
MRAVTPRSFRSRFLLLPLALGVLLVSSLLTGSSALTGLDLHAGAVCSNVDPKAKSVLKPRSAPSCVNCRAPLLNAPLARTDRAPTTPIVALPPAA